MAQLKPAVVVNGEIETPLATDVIAPQYLGSGLADSTTFLRGDGTYAVPAGNSIGLTSSQILARTNNSVFW